MMRLALVTVWLVALFFKYSYCTEEKDQCNNDDCTVGYRAMFPSRYAQEFNMVESYEHDRSYDDNSKSEHGNNMGRSDRELDNIEVSLAANEANFANDIGEKKQVFVNQQAEYLRYAQTKSQERIIPETTDSSQNTISLTAGKRFESSVNGAYEFPPMKRLVPGSVGDVVELHIQPGIVHKRITRATEPPLFEIPNFLSFEECDVITKGAKGTLQSSGLFGAEESHTNKNSSEISRISKNTWVTETNVGSTFLKELQERLSKLTEIPIGAIQRSEPLHVVNYGPAGHYHAHVDSNFDTKVPCCFHTNCKDVEHTERWTKCCRLCRFMTVMYYLNDVIQGGETAFPLADMPEGVFQQKINDPKKSWQNLSHYCHNSSVVVSPKKGTAIVWYTHFVDEKGYLGPVDLRSNHGGCDIIRGEKWIATHWISETTYADRFKKSMFGNN